MVSVKVFHLTMMMTVSWRQIMLLSNYNKLSSFINTATVSVYCILLRLHSMHNSVVLLIALMNNIIVSMLTRRSRQVTVFIIIHCEWRNTLERIMCINLTTAVWRYVCIILRLMQIIHRLNMSKHTTSNKQHAQNTNSTTNCSLLNIWKYNSTCTNSLVRMFILCTITVHNAARNRSDNLPSYILQTLITASTITTVGKGTHLTRITV